MSDTIEHNVTDNYLEHSLHVEYDEKCSECYKELKCKECKDKGFIIKTEWGDDDKDYEVEVPCRECKVD